MFVKPRSAFVGIPSLVASSSGSAKYARYARLLPSTRKSSDSRAGASSSWSSAPVSVLGMLRVYCSGRSRPGNRKLLLAEVGLADLLVPRQGLRFVRERDVA